MRTKSSFRLRTVLLGVVAGLVVVSLGFYGWVEWRRSEYHHRERAVLTRYHQDYRLCVSVGNAAAACASRVMNNCVADAFWRFSQPFASDPDAALPDPVARCRSGVTG